MGIDDLFNDDHGGNSCIVGIAAASLSSLVCIVFLAVEIFSRDGLLHHFCVRPLGIVDFTLACITCLLWFSETIYAIHDVAVTFNTFDGSDHGSGSGPDAYTITLPTSIRVAAAFFCVFSGLSVLIWVSEQDNTFYSIDMHHSTLSFLSKPRRVRHRQTDMQIDRQAGRQAGRQADRQTDRHTWPIFIRYTYYTLEYRGVVFCRVSLRVSAFVPFGLDISLMRREPHDLQAVVLSRFQHSLGREHRPVCEDKHGAISLFAFY